MAAFRDPNDQERALIALYTSTGNTVVGIGGEFFVVRGEWEPPTPAAPRIRLRGILLDQRFHSILGHAQTNPGQTVSQLADALQDFKAQRREYSPDHTWQLFA